MLALSGAVKSGARSRRASLYRVLRRLHLWISVIAALPVVLLSLTGALLVFGHELEAFLLPERPAIVPSGERLSYQAVLDGVKRRKPELTVWSIGGNREVDEPLHLWLANGAGALEVDPYTGQVLRHYIPSQSPYGIVKALHRRWLVGGKTWAPVARHAISVISLALMIQVVLGIWLWALPPKRLRRLQPDFRHSGRLALQRLHVASGVVTGAVLLLIAFTGIAMWWHESIEPLVEAVTASRVEKPEKPVIQGLAPLRDLDAAVDLALAAVPASRVAHFRVPGPEGEPSMIALRTPDTYVTSHVWVGDHPPRVLGVFDGRQASAATWFWQMRYWLHLGDFAGWPVRVLWLVVSLMPTVFVVSGLWLWRDRYRPRTRRN